MKSRICIFCLTVVLVFFCGLPLVAGPRVNIDVMTILASKGKPFVDPKLSGRIRDLKSVFNYSSYRLLGQKSVVRGLNQTGRVRLPGGRALEVTPVGIKGKRVRLNLVVSKKGRESFRTQVQLLNGGKITVGGPRHKGGVLLFHISGGF